jgi:hypothetical protein
LKVLYFDDPATAMVTSGGQPVKAVKKARTDHFTWFIAGG